jgi:copper chaperone CopZ
MKTKVELILALFFTGIFSALGQDVETEKFKVYGNCGMCEKRIEKAAESVEGVSEADWDKETKMVEVTFDKEKVEVMDVHKAIAAMGHDTEKVEAKDKDYDALPGCCRYERPVKGE